MENASKALIIAGAVLIAILLISLTLIIIKNANPVIKQTDQVSKTIEAHTFNSQFLPYVGDSVRGSQVRSLCDVIIANNGNGTTGKSVSINGATISNNISSYRNSIKINQNYKVTPEYDSNRFYK